MRAVRNERFLAKLYKLKPNSAYEYETQPCAEFFCAPLSPVEMGSVRIESGLDGGEDGTTIITSNLYKEAKVGDRVEFMGKYWTIVSVGLYIDDWQMISPELFSDWDTRYPRALGLG